MNLPPITAVLALGLSLTALTVVAQASPGERLDASDSRIRTHIFKADAVVRVPVQRGLITQIVLAQGEHIVGSPATGRGADCGEPSHTWCVAVQGGDIFLKPKTGASRTNLLVMTSLRRYAFDLQPVSGGETPVVRLTMLAPSPPAATTSAATPVALAAKVAPVAAADLLRARWNVKPIVRNEAYSVANGEASDDIVPLMVFDDGTQTYFQFPNNRPVPAIFQVAPDGSEQTVNVRMDVDDLLVADRVARRFVLRLGRSVAAVINDAFDLDGIAPNSGTTVPGVVRVVKAHPLAGGQP